MKAPKELTRVTTTSKTLALICFITLPIIGFFLGMQYQQNIQEYERYQRSLIQHPTAPTPSVTPEE